MNAANLHDVDNRYSWAGEWSVSNMLCQPNSAAAGACAAQTGGATGCDECPGVGEVCNVDPHKEGAITTIWDWLTQSIFDVGEGVCAGLTDACIDPIFGPTVSVSGGAAFYWSASEFILSNFAWGFSFSGGPGGDGKPEALWVRAVRSAQ